MINLQLSKSDLNKIFPFILILSKNLEINYIGKSLSKLYPNLEVNSSFFDNFRIVRPYYEDKSTVDFKNLQSKLVVIENRNNPNIKLKGHFEQLEHTSNINFFGSPWFNNSSEILENKLTIEDFAIHDSTSDLIHILQNSEIITAELEENIKKVSSQKKDLIVEQKKILEKSILFKTLSEASEALQKKDNLNNLISDAFQFFLNNIPKLEKFSFYQKNDKDSFQKELNLNLSYFTPLIEEEALNFPLLKGRLALIISKKENTTWSKDEVSLLKSFSNILDTKFENQLKSTEIFNMALFPMENPDPVLRVNTEGKILLLNNAAEKIDHLIIHNKKRKLPVLFKFLNKHINNENRSITVEAKYLKTDYLVNARFSSNNEHINVYLSDITRLKEAEAIIQSKNQELDLLQNLIDNSSDSIHVLKENGQFIYINKTASERLGIPINNCKEFNIKDFSLNLKGDWKNYLKKLKEEEYLTITGINKNRTTNIEIATEATVKYIKINNEGYIITNSRNISERLKAEKKIKIQEEKYRNIIENMNLGLLEVDLNEKIVYLNNSFSNLSGYEPNEILNKNATEVFLIDKKNTVTRSKTDIRKKGVSDSYEVLVKIKNDEYRWWLISGAPNFNDEGEVIGSIGIHLDITDQKKLEHSLEKAAKEAQNSAKAKEAFLTNMSHEIRTPLNGIIGMIRELNKTKTTPQQKEIISIANKASNHLLTIINNILDISKIESGEVKLDLTPFNIRNTVDNVLEIVSNSAKEKNINIELKIDEHLKSNHIGDSSRLSQILLNIIGNSIKFSQNTPLKINVASSKLDINSQLIEFTVEDFGIGMSEDYIKTIFTKFNQEDNHNNRKEQGTGLGLVITKELTELMHGAIEISSKKNIGTKIKISIPFLVTENNLEIELKKEKLNINLNNTRILIAEDNEMNIEVLKSILKPHNPILTIVKNGQEAIDICKNETFDLILMDIQMPLVDGIEATKTLKKKEKINTPIIAVSANAFKNEIDKCYKAGMSGYIIKPYEEEELLQIIQEEVNKTHIKLYDLNKLIKMSKNDTEFINRMTNLFIKVSSETLVNIDKALKDGDISIIKKEVHKLKPTFNNMSITILDKDIKILENHKSKKITKEIKSVIMDINKNLTLLIQQLKLEKALKVN